MSSNFTMRHYGPLAKTLSQVRQAMADAQHGSPLASPPAALALNIFEQKLMNMLKADNPAFKEEMFQMYSHKVVRNG